MYVILCFGNFPIDFFYKYNHKLSFHSPSFAFRIQSCFPKAIVVLVQRKIMPGILEEKSTRDNVEKMHRNLLFVNNNKIKFVATSWRIFFWISQILAVCHKQVIRIVLSRSLHYLIGFVKLHSCPKKTVEFYSTIIIL